MCTPKGGCYDAERQRSQPANCSGRKKNSGLAFKGLSRHITTDVTRYGRKRQKVTLEASKKPAGRSYSGSVFSLCRRAG
jgi:hypothetical protein